MLLSRTLPVTAHEKLYQDHCSDSSSILAGIILFAVLTSGTVTQDTSRRAITALNDIARTAEANRSELHTLETCGYSGDFVILDMTDNVLYANTVSEDKLSLEKAMQKRYPYQYLKNDSGIWDA